MTQPQRSTTSMQQILENVRRQHKELLLQMERPEEADVEQVRKVLKVLAQAGATTEDVENRALLLELIRYWSIFINDKTGTFPVVQLEPFDASLPRNRETEETHAAQLKTVAKPRQARKIHRTLFIGLGGTGAEVIRRVKQEALRHAYDLPLFQYLVLDTVAFDEKPGMPALMHLRNGEEYLSIGGYNPNEVLKEIGNWPMIASWWGSRARTGLVTVDEGAGQARSVGRMGFFYYFTAIEVQLRRMVQDITSVSNREQAMLAGYDVSETDPIVYLVFSLCGGTGSSLFFDVAYVVRSLLSAHGLKPTIVGLAMLPGPYLQSVSSIPQQQRLQANSYAALMELERLHDMAIGLKPRPNGKDIWSVRYASNFQVDSADLPFEYIYLIDDKTVKGETQVRERIYTALGKALFWLSGPSTASQFWERAKNLIAKSVASGGQPDASGRRRLTLYSSLGVSTVRLDWQFERLQYELENLFIEQIRNIPAVRPTLPSYLHNTVNLREHVNGEATGINPFPASKALQAPEHVNDTLAIDEMHKRQTEKYQNALNTFIRSAQWRLKRDECKRLIVTLIDDHLRTSLCERGPVAAAHELDLLREHLVGLITTLDDVSQEAKRHKATLDDDDSRTAVVVQPISLLQQTFANLGEFLKRLYIVQSLRRPTARKLRSIAHKKARNRYQWYTESFTIQTCDDIVKTILEPAIAHTDKLKATCDGVDAELETWYEANTDIYRVNGLPHVQEHIDYVRPLLSEKGQVEEALKEGQLKIDQKVAQILQTFSTWPKAGRNAMDDLRPALQTVVASTITTIGGIEHLVHRLGKPDMRAQRNALLEGADCMWSFTKDVTPNILTWLERIELFGYGVDERTGITAPDLDPALDDLLRNQAIRPEKVLTDISGEVVLLKTSHGLPVSAVHRINELQHAYHAYQVMNAVRGAPYLHIDHTDQVRAGYGPLVHVMPTHREVLTIWKDEAASIDQSDPQLGNAVQAAIQNYEAALQWQGIHVDTLVDVKDESDLFFEFVDALRMTFLSLSQTPAVSLALMKLADLEDILHTQGWVKHEPAYGERFHANLHQVRSRRTVPGISRDRVIEVVRPEYSRQLSADTTQTRLAIIDVSD